MRRLEQDCQARDKAARAKDSQLADLNKRFAALRLETEATVNLLNGLKSLLLDVYVTSVCIKFQSDEK